MLVQAPWVVEGRVWGLIHGVNGCVQSASEASMREAGGRASRTTARCEGMANGQLTEVEAGLVEDRDEYEARHLEDNVEHLV